MPVGLILINMVLDDQLLADSEGVTYSARPEMQNTPENPTEFELYSDRIERMFPSYALEDNLRIVPGPETPTVNFDWLKELLLSKDISRDEELAWASKELRFLDAKVDMTGNRVGFLSFARTGNTMTRNLIESISGVFTGSNMPLMTTSMFQMMGMAGEGHNCDDNSVWVTKSHWP